MLRLTARLRRAWLGYVTALVAVGAVSGAISLLRLTPVANLSTLYLIAVLACAASFGRGPAVFAAVLAFLTFDWLFIEPRYTFTVTDPAEWVALLLFLLTAIITGELAAGQRRQAHEAQQREREAVVLYDVARLMGEPDLESALRAVAEGLRRELRLAAVAIEIAEGTAVHARATVGEPEALDLARGVVLGPSHLLGEGPLPSAAQRGAPGRWIRIVSPVGRVMSLRGRRERLRVVPVKSGERRVGTVVIVSAPDTVGLTSVDDRLLSAVAAQLGLAVERVRLRHELTAAEILRRTDELKTALLSAVSHDLRTPLAAIITSAESLLRRDVGWSDEDRLEFAESIRNEALRLNRIVLNLLDLSRIEAGSLRPQRGWYDLRALIDDVLGRLRPLTAGHPLVVDVPEGLPPVELDYVEIDQVLANLVENAARHTPDGAAIEVRARAAAGEVRVEVADRGPGVPEAALPQIFEPFVRADVRRPRPKGLGLGLAVVRGLVEAHGGRVSAANRPGGGASFVFTLPLATTATADGAAARSGRPDEVHR